MQDAQYRSINRIARTIPRRDFVRMAAHFFSWFHIFFLCNGRIDCFCWFLNIVTNQKAINHNFVFLGMTFASKKFALNSFAMHSVFPDCRSKELNVPKIVSRQVNHRIKDKRWT